MGMPEERHLWASPVVAGAEALVTRPRLELVALAVFRAAVLVAAEHQSQVARLVPVEQGAVA